MSENAKNAACYPQPGGPQPPRLWSREMSTCMTTTIPSTTLDMRRKAEILKYKANSAQLTKNQRFAQIVNGNGPLAKKVWANQNDVVSQPNVDNLPLIGNTLLVCTYPFDWVLEQTYFGSNGTNRYGASVSLNGDGTILAVGQPDTFINNAVYIFTKTTLFNITSWSSEPIATINNPNLSGKITDFFGDSVSLNTAGNILAVGAQKYNGSKGIAYVYNNNGSWSSIPNFFSFSSGSPSAGTINFGRSVSLNNAGTILGVGAPNDYGDIGRAYTFTDLTSSKTTPTATYNDATYNSIYEFGTSVCVKGDGNTLVGGTYGNGATSFADLFIGNISSSTPNTRFGLFTGQFNFGYSVSLNNDNTLLAVGNPDFLNPSFGKVFLFKKTGATWNSDMTFNNGSVGGAFGYSVSLSGDGTTLAVGNPTPNSNPSLNNIGIVYLYKSINGNWTNTPSIVFKNPNPSILSFGHSVSLNDDGNTIAIGAVGQSGVTAGAVYIYTYKSTAPPPIYCSPSSSCDVPGPVVPICYNPSVPLVNYIVRRTYLAGGTKFPQTCWKPGDNGFPVGKAGKMFYM